MKTPHQTDIRDSALIDGAAYFVASVFLGTGQFDKSEQTNLEDARTVARQMSLHYKTGRQGMVYAILPDGRSIFVPNTYQPKEKEMTDAVTNTDKEIPGFLKHDKIPAQKPAKTKGASTKRVPAAKTKKAKAAKAAKPAKAAKAPKAKAEKKAKTPRPTGGKRGAILEAAKRGEMPTPPDFSANTHKPHRKRLDEVVALAKAGDVKGLKAFQINPTSTSPRAIARYRDLAVTALEAKAA